MGVSYDLFWSLTPFKLKPFIKAYELRQRDRDREMWLQGAYVYKAIESFVPILVTIPEKNAKPLPYPSEPFWERQIQLDDEENKKKHIENERLRAYQNFKIWANAVEQKYKKE